MVLPAPSANNFTILAINIQSSEAVQREVDLTERSIRLAANRQQFNVLHDARIIGNPPGDPQDDNILTQLQIDYRDAFISAGYLVTLDADSGLWRLSWESQGVEGLVTIYSIRTTVVPGAIIQPTIDAVEQYFDGQVPVARSRCEFNANGSGGDIDEADFGGTGSVFYEYIAVVQQQDPTTDFSTGVRNALTSTALGYQGAPSNVFVYRVA